MQLHRSQISAISRRIVSALVSNEAIEVTSQREVVLDVEAVLNSYLSESQDVIQQARDLVQQRGLAQGEFARIKKLIADQRGIKLGEDGLDYLLDQLVEMLMHSGNVEEVFAEDHELRRQMRPALRESAAADQQVDAEVRSKLKHVAEGSRVWEIEYRRMKEDIKRRRGLS